MKNRIDEELPPPDEITDNKYVWNDVMGIRLEYFFKNTYGEECSQMVLYHDQKDPLRREVYHINSEEELKPIREYFKMNDNMDVKNEHFTERVDTILDELFSLVDSCVDVAKDPEDQAIERSLLYKHLTSKLALKMMKGEPE